MLFRSSLLSYTSEPEKSTHCKKQQYQRYPTKGSISAAVQGGKKIQILHFTGNDATMGQENRTEGAGNTMMWKVLIIILIILIILVIILVALYYFGNKMQKKQAENQAQLDAMAQTVSMLIIDKKRLRVKDSGLPAMVIDQVPKYLRRSKMPIVKAKVGPKVMNLIADEKVFELLPVKKEVKVVVSGIYITAIKGARGGIEKPEPKKGFFKRLFHK